MAPPPSPSLSDESDPNDSNYVPLAGEVEASSHATHAAEIEDPSDIDDEIDPTRFQGPRKIWTATEYTKARTIDAYVLANDSPTP